MDPQFDERDAGAGATPGPEPEWKPEPAARQAPEPAADDGRETGAEPGLEPDPAPAQPAGSEPEAEAEAVPQLEPVPAWGLASDQTAQSGAQTEPGPEAESEPSQAETVMLDTRAEPEERGSVLHRMRMAFRRWRRSRPFWGGFLVNLGGLEVLYSMKAPLKVIVHFGPLGIAGYLLPLIMLLCGLLLWFNPAQRTFYSILSVLLALGTWITSNLGGFIIGLLLGVVGGSLAFGWRPFTDEEVEEREAKRSRKKALRARRKAARSGRASGAGGTRTAHSGRAARTARARRIESAGGGDPEIGKPTQA